jgi:hypothetical protein
MFKLRWFSRLADKHAQAETPQGTTPQCGVCGTHHDPDCVFRPSEPVLSILATFKRKPSRFKQDYVPSPHPKTGLNGDWVVTDTLTGRTLAQRYRRHQPNLYIMDGLTGREAKWLWDAGVQHWDVVQARVERLKRQKVRAELMREYVK